MNTRVQFESANRPSVETLASFAAAFGRTQLGYTFSATTAYFRCLSLPQDAEMARPRQVPCGFAPTTGRGPTLERDLQTAMNKGKRRTTSPEGTHQYRGFLCVQVRRGWKTGPVPVRSRLVRSCHTQYQCIAHGLPCDTEANRKLSSAETAWDRNCWKS